MSDNKHEKILRCRPKDYNEAVLFYSVVDFYGTPTKAAARNDIDGGQVRKNYRVALSFLDATDQCNKPIVEGTYERPESKYIVGNKKRYVFTAAQNNTHIHLNFFKTLLTFCNYKGAELLVSKMSYNKNAYRKLSGDDVEFEEEWFDPAIRDYLFTDTLQIAPDLVFAANMNILPTAVNPLSGLDSYTKESSGIFGHTKVRMQAMPVMKGKDPRIIYTTGTCTLRNYIQQKTGQKAEFHHTFAALYVEIDDKGDWFARHLVSDENGAFYDLDILFDGKKVKPNQRVLAINWGDVHVEMLDPFVRDGAWDADDSMVKVLRPEYQFMHDVSDFKARNHHNIKDPYFLAEQYHNDIDIVEDGLSMVAHFLHDTKHENCKTVVVDSNHDRALVRWLKEAPIKTDPQNARFWHECNAHIFGCIERGMKSGQAAVLKWALQRLAPLDDVLFLETDESFVLAGVEFGMHGDLGINGSRGSPKAFTKLGTKANTGHTHTPSIIDGVYTAGVSATLDMGYNSGPSSWMQAHIVTYPNGKRAIIFMRKGRWRA